MGLSLRSATRSLVAVSSESDTSLDPLGRILSSYAVTASFNDDSPVMASWTASTISAASCIALFNPCPRSLHCQHSTNQKGRICYSLGSIEWAASPAIVTVPLQLSQITGDHCCAGSAGSSVSSGRAAAAVLNGSQILEALSLKNRSRVVGLARSDADGAPHQAWCI